MNRTQDTPCTCDAAMPERILIEIFSGDVARIRAAKKELHAFFTHAPHHTDCKTEQCDFLFEISTRLLALEKEPAPQALALVLSTLSNFYMYFYTTLKGAHAAAEVIQHFLLHENGGVREAARKMLRSWSTYDFSDGNDVPEEVQKMVLFINAALYGELRKRGAHETIDNLAPCVYKTLMLAWEDVTLAPYVEEWLVRHPELLLDQPTREWEDSGWEPEDVDRGEVMLHLWKKEKCDKEVRRYLTDLHGYAEERLQKLLTELLEDTVLAVRLTRRVARLGEKGSEMESAVVAACVAPILEKGHSIHHVAWVIREIQAYMNHSLHTEPHLYSLYAVAGASEWREDKRKGQLNMHRFLETSRDVHKAIDVFARKWQERECKQHGEFVAAIRGLEKDKGECYTAEKKEEDAMLKKERLQEVAEVRSIAHHLWDWYAQTNPWFREKRAEQWAALVYAAVVEINMHDRNIFIPCTGKELAVFGGWKTLSGIHASAASMLHDVLPRVIERDLLHALVSNPDAETEKEEYELADSAAIESPAGMVKKGYPRCFAVVSTEHKRITPEQEKRIMDAAEAVCEKDARGIFEEIGVKENCAIIVLGIGFDIPPAPILEEILITANGTEPFLRFHYLLNSEYFPLPYEIEAYLASFEKGKKKK